MTAPLRTLRIRTLGGSTRPFCGRPFFYEPGRVRIDGVRFNSENRLPDVSLEWRVRRAAPAPK